MEFFNKTKLLTDSYASKVESINDKEIGRLFERKSNEKTKDIDLNELKDYKGFEDKEFRTKLEKQQSIELAKNFFKSIHNRKAKEALRNLEGKNKNIQVNISLGNRANGFLETPQKDDLKMNCCFVGDLRDVYTLVHEVTHTLDIKNEDTSTRRILGEVAPSCMEDLVDDFLNNLHDKDRYGIDEDILKEDIKDRKITRFLQHYGNTRKFNRAMENGSGRSLASEKDSRYMLAEIYQAKFNQFDFKTKQKKIFKFIKCVENNKFEKANETFGLNFPNEIEKHVLDTIDNVIAMLNFKSKKKKNYFKVEKYEQRDRTFDLVKLEEKEDYQVDRW
ncbi:MAG: hypothetical protein K6B70_05625 [Clostridia bacterium]|nr:hypothetical protein [Clostridia bacterium]